MSLIDMVIAALPGRCERREWTAGHIIRYWPPDFPWELKDEEIYIEFGKGTERQPVYLGFDDPDFPERRICLQTVAPDTQYILERLEEVVKKVSELRFIRCDVTYVLKKWVRYRNVHFLKILVFQYPEHHALIGMIAGLMGQETVFRNLLASLELK